jgi:hypothetical protein
MAIVTQHQQRLSRLQEAAPILLDCPLLLASLYSVLLSASVPLYHRQRSHGAAHPTPPPRLCPNWSQEHGEGAQEGDTCLSVLHGMAALLLWFDVSVMSV